MGDQQKLASKVFRIRRKIAAGKPVTEEEKRIVAEYETKHPQSAKQKASRDGGRKTEGRPREDRGPDVPPSSSSSGPEPLRVDFGAGSASPGPMPGAPSESSSPTQPQGPSLEEMAGQVRAYYTAWDLWHRKKGGFAVPDPILDMFALSTAMCMQKYQMDKAASPEAGAVAGIVCMGGQTGWLLYQDHKRKQAEERKKRQVGPGPEEKKEKRSVSEPRNGVDSILSGSPLDTPLSPSEHPLL